MRRRRLALALAAYGVLSLVLLVVGAVLAFDAAGRAERLAGSADRALRAAIGSASAAADAVDGTDASLIQGQSSADQAAILARDASATLSRLSSAMEISIFGTQPLVALADDFAASAEQANLLGDELDTMGGALGGSREDLATVADRLRELAVELSALRDGEDAGEAAGSPPATAPPLRVLIGVMVAWLALPAIGALIAAALLWRRSPDV